MLDMTSVIVEICVRYSEGPLFWKSTIPTNPKPNPSLKLTLTLILTQTLTLTLTLTLTQTLALWRVSAQWTFGIVDLQNSGPVPLWS